MDYQQELFALINAAAELGASDLHVVVGMPPTVRFHGGIETIQGPSLSADEARALLLAGLDETQKRRLQSDGCVELCFTTGQTRCRGSVYMQRGMVEGSFRLIQSFIPSREELGLPPFLPALLNKSGGLIIITGSGGMGKTTTLNWMVDHINQSRRWRNITIENPVEYIHRSMQSTVAQREVGTDTPVRNLIREGRTAQMYNLISTNRTSDMVTLEASVAELVQKGLVMWDDALEAVNDIEMFQALYDEAGLLALV